MFFDMSTHTKILSVIFAIFWCCVVPRFECCDPGKRMTLEEKVDGSNIVLLGTVLAHYAENGNNMFTAEIQVKCFLKIEKISVHNVINASHAGKDSGGHCFDNTLTINSTYYIFLRIVTLDVLVPGTEEIPEKSSEANQLLTTCGLSVATGPGTVKVCDGLKSSPCPTTTPQPPSTRRAKTIKTPGTTATVVQVTSASASRNIGTTATVVQVTSASASRNIGTTATVVQVTSASASRNIGTTATVVQVTSASASRNIGTTATVVQVTSASASRNIGTTATVVQVTSASASRNIGTTATVVQVTSASASRNIDDKVETKDSNVGAILGGVLGTLAAGGVAATIFFFVKNKNKKVSITKPQKDKIMEDEDLSEIPMSKPPMVTEAIEKF